MSFKSRSVLFGSAVLVAVALAWRSAFSQGSIIHIDANTPVSTNFDGLTLTLKPDKPVADPCQPIYLSAVLKNTSKKTYLFYRGSWGGDWTLDVRGQNGENAPLTAMGKTMGFDSPDSSRFEDIWFKSGQELRFKLLANLAFDMTKPMRYSLVAKHVILFPYLGPADQPKILLSNEVSVWVKNSSNKLSREVYP